MNDVLPWGAVARGLGDLSEAHFPLTCSVFYFEQSMNSYTDFSRQNIANSLKSRGSALLIARLGLSSCFLILDRKLGTSSAHPGLWAAEEGFTGDSLCRIRG